MPRIKPVIKGVITGTVILAFLAWLFLTNQPPSSSFEYIRYGIYAAGIAWTLIDYLRSPAYTAKFGDLFAQGFRCFIVVTLMISIFIMAYSMTHPEMAEESAQFAKQEMVKQGDMTTPEIEESIRSYKKQFTTKLVSGAIFGNLIAGAIFTAFGAGLLLIRRQL